MRRTVLLLVCSVWLIVFDNARLNPEIVTFQAAHLFPLPRSSRLLEVALILVLYLSVAFKRRDPFLRAMNLLLLVFVGGGVLSMLLAGNVGEPQFEAVYIYAAPIMVFLVASRANLRHRHIELYAVIFGGYTAASVLFAAMYQIPKSEGNADNITGFFSNAHVFGTSLATFSFVFFLMFLHNRRSRYLVLSLSVLLFSLYPADEKMVVFTVLGMAAALLVGLHERRGAIGRAALLVGVAAVVGVFFNLFVDVGHATKSRILTVLSKVRLGSFGPLLSWPHAFHRLLATMGGFFLGVGPANYGSLAAATALRQGSGTTASQQLAPYLMRGDHGVSAAFLFVVNTWTALLAEFGVVGFLLLSSIIGMMIWRLLAVEWEASEDGIIKATVIFLVLSLIYQGMFTPFTNWGDAILAFPTMVCAGYVYANDRRLERD